MKKLWQKNTSTGGELNSFIEHFETKDDIVNDQKLVKFDVYASIAHAKMLGEIGVLSHKEVTTLVQGLLETLELSEKNNFELKPGDEDIHTKIENYLTEKYGEVGKKIHTGRSRNDQILTALRLFSKEQILSIWQELLILIESFQTFAEKYKTVPMPGYTHMQKAMPSTVGMWAGAYTESLLDDLKVLKIMYELNNQSPLGSAAGYGVPLLLDREYTSKMMGFDKVQINPIYSQNSRGKIEANIISAVNTILLDINKFATDILLFTTSEFDYFKVSDKLITGSSIMPQKKNIDIAELLRSKIHITLGNYVQIMSMSSNLISGFNRDLQDSKKIFMESLTIINDSIIAANILINNITPKKEMLKKALTPEIFATHQALELVSKGIPFRNAYQTIGNNLSEIDINSDDFINKSTHTGGTGNLQLENYANQIEQEKQEYKSEYDNFDQAIKKLLYEK